LVRCPVGLPLIAGSARGDSVLPERTPTLSPRLDVVHGELVTRIPDAAILTGVGISLEESLSVPADPEPMEPVKLPKSDDGRDDEFPPG